MLSIALVLGTALASVRIAGTMPVTDLVVVFPDPAEAASVASFAPPAGTTTPADTTVPRDVLESAYLDAAAREIVERARRHLTSFDLSVREYRTRARERISVGLKALRRDRMLYRRELAADLHWRRDGPGTVRLLGAREVVPIAKPRPEVPDDAVGDAASLAFDPSRDLVVAQFGRGDGGIRNPIAPGSEADYRFATGDTTRIRLQNGRVVRLVELRVIPRRTHGLLVRGSMWIDVDTDATVRGVFQLARPLDVVRDLGDGDGDRDIPRILRPMIMELKHLTVDYGLWEDRWWMPRLVTIEGEARVGDLARVPVRFERTYENYEVRGGDMPPLLPLDSTGADLVAAARQSTRAQVPPLDSAGADLDDADAVAVGTPADSATRAGELNDVTDERARFRFDYDAYALAEEALLGSDLLPTSIYDQEGLITPQALRDLVSTLDVGAGLAGGWHPPLTRLAYLRPRLIRYNRVQGLALGVAGVVDVGPLMADAEFWLGTADLDPYGAIGITANRPLSARAGAYHRIEAAGPRAWVGGFGQALGAFLFGRDDVEYYRATGLELANAADRDASGLQLRLFYERQTPVERNAGFSIAHLLNGDNGFPDVIGAAPANQVGAEFGARIVRGADPLGVRWSAAANLLVEGGAHDLVRPQVEMAIGLPLTRGLVAAVDLAGGAVYGEKTPQREWYVGGIRTVRGYGLNGGVSGDAFWIARAEVGSTFTGARVTAFADAGWAGARERVTIDPALLSAGVGVGFLDGLVRIDLSRAIHDPVGWRLDVYTDGIL